MRENTGGLRGQAPLLQAAPQTQNNVNVLTSTADRKRHNRSTSSRDEVSALMLNEVTY